MGIIAGTHQQYLTVEKQNKKKDERFEEQLDNLRNATQDVRENLTNLKEIRKVSDIMSALEKMVNKSNKKSNELYFFTHLTNFGQFLIRNLEIITSESQYGKEDFKNLSSMDFFDRYMKNFERKKDDLNEAITNFAKKGKTSLGCVAE